MTEIKDDQGRVFVLKSEMESIIKERIGKVASRASTAENQVKELQQKLEESSKAQGTVDILSTQIQDLQDKLSQSNTRFDRYKAISKHGLTDGEMIDAVEWSYERAMNKKNKKDRVSLSDWLDGCVQNPEAAPKILRPHFDSLSQQRKEQQPEENTTPAQIQQLSAFQNRPIPKANANVRKAPEQPDIMQRGISDPEFYKANREAIQAAWMNSTKRR